MDNQNRIHRFRWGMLETAQVWIAHCGSKSTPLIAQLCRQIGLKSRILRLEDLPAAFDQAADKPRLVILSGGDQSVYDPGSPTLASEAFDQMRRHSAFLGICYGCQLLAQICGGKVERAKKGEYGIVRVEIFGGAWSKDPLTFGKYAGGEAVMNHGDEVVELPSAWEIVGSTPDCKTALIGAGNVWGAQFHPEMDHTEYGDQLLEHIAFGIARCTRDYVFKTETFVREATSWLNEVAPSGKVLLGLSGGVDSSVAYKVAKIALGDRLHAIYVDTGWCRENETDEVRRYFGEEGVSYVNASERFHDALEAIAYPSDGHPTVREHRYYDQVRKVMGETFINVFLDEAKRLDLNPVALIQGTNVADIIESETGLKRHHNVGGLPDKLGVAVIEPLAGLYKFEIRELAVALGLPEAVAYRQPFPGPGLAIRQWGKLDRSLARPAQRANAILEEVVAKYWPSYGPERPCQYYVAIQQLPTTGLMGDERVVGYLAMVRMVWSRSRESYASLEVKALRQEVQDVLSRRLTAEVRMEDVTRIVGATYLLSGKPPATTEPH